MLEIIEVLFLRVWDLISGDNYALLLKETLGYAAKERLTSVSYCKARSKIDVFFNALYFLNRASPSSSRAAYLQT